MNSPATATRTLGSVLAGVRTTARLKQSDIAVKLGFGEDRVSNIENDKSPVTVQLFLEWCAACDTNACDVLNTVPR